jgi:hypothetical protein
MIAESTAILPLRRTRNLWLSVLLLSQKTYKRGDLLLSYPAFTHPDNEHSDATSY